VTAFLEVFGFLAVLLRGLQLACLAVVGGGWLFRWRVADSAGAERLMSRAAIGLAATWAAITAVDSLVLRATARMPWGEIAGASFFLTGTAGTIAGLLTARFAWSLHGTLLPVATLFACALATSHAVARMELAVPMAVATLIHQLATAAWIGGLVYFQRAVATGPDPGLAAARFSRIAQISVAALIAAGLGMAAVYVGSPEALYGTAYGVMLVGKVVLLGCLLVLGPFNFFLARDAQRGSDAPLRRMRCFSEAEIGIGLTIIFAAASLTSQPPAADLTVNRVSWPELAARTVPKTPRLETPPWSALSPPTPLNPVDAGEFGRLESYVPGSPVYRPSLPGDIAWSEYNHNWAGVVVLIAGVLAALNALGIAVPLTRHWPLAFLGLGAFLLLRADPENWPLGPRGFWESFQVAEVLQHRLFVVLIAIFAFFEWSVRVGRIASRRAALVFPAICALGGALLLTHSHSVNNVKEELLQEISHVPIAIAGVVAGWSRWLELRLPGGNRLAAALWPVCLMLIGLVLLFYREA
jgi:putative copper resistance protein D